MPASKLNDIKTFCARHNLTSLPRRCVAGRKLINITFEDDDVRRRRSADDDNKLPRWSKKQPQSSACATNYCLWGMVTPRWERSPRPQITTLLQSQIRRRRWPTTNALPPGTCAWLYTYGADITWLDYVTRLIGVTYSTVQGRGSIIGVLGQGHSLHNDRITAWLHAVSNRD